MPLVRYLRVRKGSPVEVVGSPVGRRGCMAWRICGR